MGVPKTVYYGICRNRKWALYNIMYRLAPESVEKEAKLLLRPEMNRKWSFISDQTLAGSGEIENSLVRAANQQGRSAGALEVCP